MANAVVGALRVNLGIDTAAFSDGLKRATTSLKSVGRSMQMVGGVMSAAITAPLILFGKQTIAAAAEAEELQSAFDFSFGKMAEGMNEWARVTGDALGRSTQQLQKQAFTFNQLFKSALPEDEAAALSQQFTLLANDLSSFFNVAEGDALQKLRAGLVGEAEPLRAFGVFLSAAAVEAKALELGLGGANGELTEQEKILARAAIIMEQTTDAQGDLARTSDSFTNQQRRLSAAWEELSVAVGQKLLPALTPLVKIAGDLVNWFTQLRDYRDTVPRLFDFNGFTIVSNGLEALMGGGHAPFETFARWRRLEEDGPETVGIETLLRATCEPSRFLDLIESFILFEDARGGLRKIVAKYHQVLGVNRAIAAVERLSDNRGRLGVFWHTQGSGKSLSMVMFAEKVLRRLGGNWTFVVVTDRQELDDQIAGTFAAVGALTRAVNQCQAQNRAHLRDLLAGQERYVFSLIHKFSTEPGEPIGCIELVDVVLLNEREFVDPNAASVGHAFPI